MPCTLVVNDVHRASAPIELAQSRPLYLRRQPRHTVPHLNKVVAARAMSRSRSHVIVLDHDTIVLDLDGLRDHLDDRPWVRRNMKWSLRRSLPSDYVDRICQVSTLDWRNVKYVNSGVVILPPRRIGPIANAWLDYGAELYRLLERKAITEQLGLALALHREPRVGWLPQRLNETSWRPPLPVPGIVHYNHSDPLNRTVRRLHLGSWQSFARFLKGTSVPFWRERAGRILELLDSQLETLHSELVEVTTRLTKHS